MTEELLRERQRFRHLALENRKQIADRKSKSLRMQQYLLDYLQNNKFSWICCYVDKEPEAETRRLIELWCNDPNVQLAVPVCDGDELKLIELISVSELADSQFGLLEPDRKLWTEQRTIDAATIDLFIVPGVAFDSSLNRIGYGKGYYDRMLARSRPTSLKVGYCFEDQVVSSLPLVQQWDYPMKHLLTENGFFPPTRVTSE